MANKPSKMTADELVKWFADNLNLIEKFSWRPVLFAVEYWNNEGLRVGYARYEDEGTAFFDGLVGTGTELTVALKHSYDSSVSLVAKLQKVTDQWQEIAPEQLKIGDKALQYWLDWNGELRERAGVVIGRSADQVRITDVDGEFSWCLREFVQRWQKL